jgi:hypothetical protein
LIKSRNRVVRYDIFVDGKKGEFLLLLTDDASIIVICTLALCYRYLLKQEGMRLLKIVAKRTAEVWKINDEGILNYFTRCLSCVLQKANASH